MEPAFRGGPDGADIVLVWRPAYWTRSPRRGEVVVYSRVPGEPAGVKRVAGLPGETVEIRGGSLWIDGTRTVFTLPHARSVVRKGPYGHRSVRLGANEYFVLGDRSYLSRDSRHWGPLRREAILGRAILVVWPWSRSGWIE